jgi:predicted RNA binding protein YcfA (HicA-like mRNA interferase family)
MSRLKNIKLATFRKFLSHKGLKCIRTSGGHEVWSRADLTRPVVLQSTNDPVPFFVIHSNLKTIGCKKQDLIDFMKKK